MDQMKRIQWKSRPYCDAQMATTRLTQHLFLPPAEAIYAKRNSFAKPQSKPHEMRALLPGAEGEPLVHEWY